MHSRMPVLARVDDDMVLITAKVKTGGRVLEPHRMPGTSGVHGRSIRVTGSVGRSLSCWLGR